VKGRADYRSFASNLHTCIPAVTYVIVFSNHAPPDKAQTSYYEQDLRVSNIFPKLAFVYARFT